MPFSLWRDFEQTDEIVTFFALMNDVLLKHQRLFFDEMMIRIVNLKKNV